MLAVNELGGEYRTECKACAVFGVVLDANKVIIRVIDHLMDTRDFTFTPGIDKECRRVFGDIEAPVGFAVEVMDKVFGEGKGGAAGGIEFMGVMNFGNANVIIAEPVHKFGEIPVNCKKYINTYAKIRGIEESFFLILAYLFYIVELV